MLLKLPRWSFPVLPSLYIPGFFLYFFWCIPSLGALAMQRLMALLGLTPCQPGAVDG